MAAIRNPFGAPRPQVPNSRVGAPRPMAPRPQRPLVGQPQPIGAPTSTQSQLSSAYSGATPGLGTTAPAAGSTQNLNSYAAAQNPATTQSQLSSAYGAQSPSNQSQLSSVYSVPLDQLTEPDPNRALNVMMSRMY